MKRDFKKRDLTKRSKVKKRRSSRSPKSSEGKGAKVTKILVIFIFTIVFISIISNLFIHTTSRTVLTKYGQLTKDFQAEGLFIRKERVVTAPIAGVIDLKISEGKKVKASTLVAKIQNNRKKRSLYSYNNGVVSYYTDGLENTLTPKYIDQLTYKGLRRLKYKINKIQEGEELNNGRPVFKIVDNFLLYLVVPIAKSKSDLFKPEMKVKFKLINFAKKDKFSAQIKKIINDKEKKLLVLKVKKFIPLFLKLRKADLTLIKASYNGIMVPNSSLAKKDSKIGVMVMNKNDQISFKEVKVLGKNQEKAIIKGIDVGTKILREPTEKMEG